MNIADLYTVQNLTDIVTTTATEAGPYLLGLVGALVVIGVGVALLWKGKRALVSMFR